MRFSTVDKSSLPGSLKAWMEVSSYLRRWLGLPRSLSSCALYGKRNKRQLPFSSLKEEFRVGCTGEALLYRDSKHSSVALVDIIVHTG